MKSEDFILPGFFFPMFLKSIGFCNCIFTLQVGGVLSDFSVVPLSFSLRISNRSQGRAISRRNTKGKSSGAFGNEI